MALLVSDRGVALLKRDAIVSVSESRDHGMRIDASV